MKEGLILPHKITGDEIRNSTLSGKKYKQSIEVRNLDDIEEDGNIDIYSCFIFKENSTFSQTWNYLEILNCICSSYFYALLAA